ncbi:hypothetical protein GQX73_g6899 [Xylaria multiplex]|uniref:Myb-like domain-containing protein n=1 Tax=Xylaria multiplex TaxID=323545 RepID=A0A7C8MRP5_9PEZI|nr:hypothetical protein GQX73_g6899 [Xylaria multiplex]
MLDMRSTQPQPLQPVWPYYRDHLPGKSHLHRYREGDSFSFLQSRLVDTPGYYIGQNCHESLSQRHWQQIMDNQSVYQRGIDSGDETCSLNDYFPESFPMAGADLRDVRSQTTAQSVSLLNCGRDVGPSHPQYSNKAVPGNEQMFFPGHPAANAYAHNLAGSFNQHQFQYPSYNPNGLCNPNLDVDTQHGLPSSAQLYADMSVFAEPFEYTHASPATLNSSFSSSAGSSIASERMASMTLESGPLQGRTPPMDFQSNYHVPALDIQEGNWAGNCPATISPKMLRINPSPTPTSSSESIQTGIPTTSGDSDLGTSAWDQHETRNALPTKHSNHKARKQLPTKPTKSQRALSPLPPPPPSLSLREPVASKRKKPTPARPNPKGHHAIEIDDPVEDQVEEVPSSSADIEREAKNRFLVDSKLAGMTYREIRRQGGFTEAESTLRGRFRTLTKNKEQRVRKPEWQDKDIRLLKKAVRKLAKGDKSSARVPWKQVATYIYEHDGSYHFGNATCRKKWDELVEQGTEELP